MVRIVIFLPGAYVGMLAIRRLGELLSSAALLKCRTHVERRTSRRQHQREQPLAAPPADAGEIFERRSFHQHDGVEFILAHQLACALLTFMALFASDWKGFAFW